MANVAGHKSIFGLEQESSPGTPVQLGAGDQRELLEGSTFDAEKEHEANEDALNEDLTASWLNSVVPKFQAKTNLRYEGHEKELGVLFGKVEDPVQQTHPLAYVTEIKIAKPTDYLTAVLAKAQGRSEDADVAEIREYSGVLVNMLAVALNEGRAVATWDYLAKAHSKASVTNTKTTVRSMTMPSSSYPPPLMHFDHMKLYAAHQDESGFEASSTYEINVNDVSWSLERALEVVRTTGGFTLPFESGRRMLKTAWNFPIEDSTAQTYLQYALAKSAIKAIMEMTADQAIPGAVTSGSTPSTDITGESNKNLSVTFTLEDGSTETVVVTLETTDMDTGSEIATEIQTKFRAATATDVRFQRFLDKFTVDYDTTVEDKYFVYIATNDPVDIEFNDIGHLEESLKLASEHDGVEHAHFHYFQRLYLPHLESSIPSDELKVGTLPKKFDLKAMATYGSDTPAGFTSSDDYLASSMSSEIARLIIGNRISSNPVS
jgi:hypothetical protein